MAVILTVLTSTAYEATRVSVDDLRYELNEKSLTAKVVGGVNRNIKEVVIPPEITYKEQQYTVTSIAMDAFEYNIEITSVTFPGTIRYVGDYAFGCCDGIKKVYANSLEDWLKIEFESNYSNPTYYAKGLIIDNENIRKITIPEGTERINDYAFVKCEELLTVTLPSSLREVGHCPFDGCSSLQRFIFPNETVLLSLKYLSDYCHLNYYNNGKYYIGSEPFNMQEVVIPADMTSIPDYAFAGWKSLEKVVLHDNIKTIGKAAFYKCNALTSLEMGNSVTSIDSKAFYECTGLTSVTIPNTVKTIGNRAFDGCKGLTSIIIPNSVTTIGHWAFGDCTSATSLEIGNSVTSIGESAFWNCRGLTEVTIPKSVQTIGEKAFSVCLALSTVEFDGYIKTIDKGAFKYCESLKEVRVQNVNDWARTQFSDFDSNPLTITHNLFVGDGTEPVTCIEIEGKEAIGDFAFSGASSIKKVRVKDGATVGVNAFANCTGLKDVCLNSTGIGETAFSGCRLLWNVYVPIETPPAAANNAFNYHRFLTLYVPKGSILAYENAASCWCNFLDIVEFDFEDLDTLFSPDYENGESGIEGIGDYTNCAPTNSIPNDIYNMQGICLLRNATEADVKALLPGMYIIGGKKVIVR